VLEQRDRERKNKERSALREPKTNWYSHYRNRDIEGSPRQKLVRFLFMHGVGTSGMPGEDLIIQCKAGYYVPELSPLEQPLEALADELYTLGHYLLSR
jgi:hypothetical protein